MSIEEDARAFGQHFQGGWQLGLLVARNVHKRRRAGRASKSEQVRIKVSCSQFAKMAGVSERTVQWYCDTWALAAEAGHCTPAADLAPGTEDPRLSGVDIDSYEFRELWTKCYREVRQRRAKNGSAESDTRRRRGGKASPSHAQTDEHDHSTDRSSNSESVSDPTAHPLYGLLLAINDLSDQLKQGKPAASVVAAAAKVATKQHRAALRRATGTF